MIIPKEVKFIINELRVNSFEAYIIGGCVRDILRGVEPNDWDITTNANPKKISEIFSSPLQSPNKEFGAVKSFTDNKFGTVAVLTGSKNPALKEIEITPYRVESKYSDKRHPGEIKWAKTIEQDLSRRDFTVNAMAIKLPDAKSAESYHLRTDIVDIFNGQKDLENKIIRAVGSPEERFDEDALRLMRATRLATTLGKAWKIEAKTLSAIKKSACSLKLISKERIKDELMKIIMSEQAKDGIELLRTLNLLKEIIPELEEGYGVGQNKHHKYDVYEHNLRCLEYAAKKNFSKYVRISALLHDIAKPRVKQGDGPDSTFYNHEVVGAKMTTKILNNLKFSNKDIEKITKLVRFHLFYYNVGEVSDSSVRRLVYKVGLENMEELLQLRMCDRIGSGCPKAEPYKLRHLKYLIEKVSQDPISVATLNVDGKEIIKLLKIKPGPKIGQILDILLGYVLSEPEKNKKEILKKEVEKLGILSDENLEKLAQKARKERERIEIKKDEMTKKKYWVT